MAHYSPSHDPSGQPWTRLSITAEISRLANELANVSNLVNGPTSPCQQGHPSTGNLTPEDEAACDALQRQVNIDAMRISVDQQQLQAIAAHLVQPGTPSVVGPGAVNVAVVPDTGEPEFITTPGVQGPIPPGPSGATGGPPTVSPNGTKPGTMSLSSLPMWVWWVGGALALGAVVWSLRDSR